jgi:hypothetical protein
VTDRSSLSSFEFLFSSSIINAAFSGEVLAVNPLCDGFWVCRIFGCILINKGKASDIFGITIDHIIHADKTITEYLIYIYNSIFQ